MMTGASRDSLAAVLSASDPQLTEGGVSLARELFAAVDVVDEQGALRRSLTDPAWSAERRHGLVDALFGQRVSPGALQVLKDLAGRRWSAERDLGDALETVAVHAAAAEAERGGHEGLSGLSRELLAFNRTAEGSHEVQWALTDQQAPLESRRQLAERLLGSDASDAARVLVERAVTAPRGRKPFHAIRSFADVVALRQRQWIADVVVARDLSEEQRNRLSQGLNRAFGRELVLDVTVDPHVVGGIRVQVGDDVIDASMASRLNDLQRRMAA
ncbi:MAG: F0F1 ATP synthase subunit delta [Micrococcus sp.]|nr:F0F1 ATP synthase subunit delta [Micrococcus sp.]